MTSRSRQNGPEYAACPRFERKGLKQCQKAELQVAEVFRRDGGEEHRTDDGVHVKMVLIRIMTLLMVGIAINSALTIRLNEGTEVIVRRTRSTRKIRRTLTKFVL